MARLRLDRLAAFEPLRRKVRRWSEDHLDRLRAADPAVPERLDDRAADNWRPLLAIADEAGGDWPAEARRTALALSGARDESDGSRGVLLLSDLRDLFRERRTDRLPTAEIVEALVGREDRPGPELPPHGQPLTARGVALLLKPFGVLPGSIRLPNGKTPKGYTREALADAFLRYLPPSGSATAPQGRDASDLHTSESATARDTVAESGEAEPAVGCGVWHCGGSEAASKEPASALAAEDGKRDG